jgi:hypothetical protein
MRGSSLALGVSAIVAGAAAVSPAAADEPLLDWLSRGVNVTYPIVDGPGSPMAELRAAMNEQNGTALTVRGAAVTFFHAEMTNLRSARGLIGDGRAQTLWLIASVTDAEGRGANPACPDPAGGEARIRACNSVVPLQIITDSQALADHLASEGHAGLVTVVHDFSVSSSTRSGADGASVSWKLVIDDPRVSLKLNLEMPLVRAADSSGTDGADFGSRPYPAAVAYGAEVTNQQFSMVAGDPGTSFSFEIRRLDLSVSFAGRTFNLGEIFRADAAPSVIRTEVRHMRLVEPPAT